MKGTVNPVIILLSFKNLWTGSSSVSKLWKSDPVNLTPQGTCQSQHHQTWQPIRIHLCGCRHSRQARAVLWLAVAGLADREGRGLLLQADYVRRESKIAHLNPSFVLAWQSSAPAVLSPLWDYTTTATAWPKEAQTYIGLINARACLLEGVDAGIFISMVEGISKEIMAMGLLFLRV